MVLRRRKDDLYLLTAQYFGRHGINRATLFALGVNAEGDLAIHWGGEECYNQLATLGEQAMYFPIERQEGFVYIHCLQRRRGDSRLYVEAEPFPSNHGEHLVDALSRFCDALFASCIEAVQDVILLTPLSEEDSATIILAPGAKPRCAFTGDTSRYPTNLRLHYNGGALAAVGSTIIYLLDAGDGMFDQATAVTIFEEDDRTAHQVHLLGRCSYHSGSLIVTDWAGRVRALEIDCLYPDPDWLEQAYVSSHAFPDLFPGRFESVVGIPGGGGVQAIATMTADHTIDRVCIRHINADQFAPLVEQQRRMEETLRDVRRVLPPRT